MKKISLFLGCLTLFAAGGAAAQIFNGSVDAVVQHAKPAVKAEAAAVKAENTAASAAEDASGEPKMLSREEIEALIKAEQPAVAMTPEQKAEIDVAAKKNLRGSVKKQSVRERRDFIGVMTSAEKTRKRREALLNGKTEAEAVRAEAEVETPDVNPAQDDEMAEYLFDKAGLNDSLLPGERRPLEMPPADE